MKLFRPHVAKSPIKHYWGQLGPDADSHSQDVLRTKTRQL